MEKEHPETEANFVEVFRTGRLWEIELVASELTKKELPFFQQEITSSGLKLAKPLATSMGPGCWWAILTPENNKVKAEELISKLPIEITKNPGIWHFSGTGKPHKIFKILCGFILAVSLVFLLFRFAETLKNAF